jgi:hypothetical protein
MTPTARDMHKNFKSIFLGCLLSLVFLLGGCVNYNVGLNIDGQYGGSIVQKIKLGEQLTSFSLAEARKWVDSLEIRAKELGGSMKKLYSQEILVTIPFGNGKELEEKFDRFFNPNTTDRSTAKDSNEKPNTFDLVKLKSNLSLKQSNLLLFERESIDLTVDLRALGVISEQGKILVNPGNLVDLKFDLNTPLGSRSLLSENALSLDRDGKKLTWQLQPGQINHIKAVFWVPSYLGIGTLAIVLLMYFSFRLKYKNKLPERRQIA